MAGWGAAFETFDGEIPRDDPDDLNARSYDKCLVPRLNWSGV